MTIIFLLFLGQASPFLTNYAEIITCNNCILSHVNAVMVEVSQAHLVPMRVLLRSEGLECERECGTSNHASERVITDLMFRVLGRETARDVSWDLCFHCMFLILLCQILCQEMS